MCRSATNFIFTQSKDSCAVLCSCLLRCASEWREQEPLTAHTTFRIGGPALYYLIPEGVDEVRDALQFARDRDLPFYVIGRGSNLLFEDDGYHGVVIEIGRGMEEVTMEDGPDGTVCVTAQAGIPLSTLAAKLAEEGCRGFEFAGGIPGTLGGAITMNAGAYGGEIRDCIKNATVMTGSGEIRALDREQLELGYRSSVIQKEDYIVLEGVFGFARGEKEAILAAMKELNQRRRDKQPLEFPSAGSTFKRPEGYFAGKLIEDAGLRGYRVGDAQVSEKHCGFVINRGKASSADVKQLIRDVQGQVREKFQVELEPEVRIVTTGKSRQSEK